MASSYPGPVQIGSYFVGQYYQVLQQQPDLVHQFYSDGSSMVHIDGDTTDTAATVQEIHSLAMSLNFSAIEIKKINSYSSWNGGVLVMVTGYVKTKDPEHYGYDFLKPKNLNGKRKFVETFFLAPQEKGYFVHNDIFQFIEESVVEQPPVPVLSEKEIDVQLNASSPHLEPPVSDYVLEEEAREYVSSVHIEDDPVDKYSLPAEQQQQEYEDYEADVVEEEFHEEEPPTSYESTLETVQEPPPPVVEEPIVEPEKKTYASILRALRDQSASSSTRQPPVKKSVPSSASDQWNHSTPVVQPSNSTLPYATESRPEPVVEDFSAEEGEFKSVYVRNLPSTITASELELEFKNFGTIKPDGVFIRNRKDAVGVCFAFVEFENSVGVQNAIKASPIQLGGRQIYIEERRPNPSGAASRGGRSGRGRGRVGYQSEAPLGRYGGGRGSGRGSYQDGYYQRGYQ